MLAILAGQGLGPIRFGATRATIERLMEAPCDVATETMCRYIPRAIEFTLDKGVVSRIRVHRIGRSAGRDKAGNPATYGAFNGAIPPDLRMGMLPWAIQEKLGKPLSVDKVSDPAFGTEELHHYTGLTVEYDRMPNGNLVMGGVTLTKADVSTPPG